MNSAIIEPGERRGAEYDYLKKYALEWLSVRNTDKEAEFLERHNRYLELVESILKKFLRCDVHLVSFLVLEYGAIEEDELKTVKNIVESTLVEMVIQHQDREISKKVPRSILVQKLVVLIQKLFRLAEKPKLLYVCVSQPDIQIELDDEGKELNMYSVNDGDKIIVVT